MGGREQLDVPPTEQTAGLHWNISHVGIILTMANMCRPVDMLPSSISKVVSQVAR